MTVSYSYDKAKVLQALRYHFINKKDIRLLLIAVNVLALVSGFLFFLKKIHPTVFLLSSFLWITLMIVFWFLMPRLIYSRTKAFKDNFMVTINSDGVQLQQEHGSRQWNYKQFQSWFESPYFFHLYTGANAFFIIPKDVFSIEQLQEVRNNFKTQIV
jgi:hypothetical protein